MTIDMLPETSSVPAKERRRLVLAVLLGVFPAGVSFTLLSTVIAFTLERRGAPASGIGLNAAMMPLATLVLAPFIPRMAARLGGLVLLIGAQVLLMATTLLYPVLDTETAWLGLRFLGGAGATIVWIVTETWLNTGADEKRRGLYVGLYGASLALGMAAGPGIVALTGSDGYAPFVAGAGLCAAVLVPVMLLVRRSPAMGDHPSPPLRHIVRAMPAAFALAAAGGLAETATFALFPVYGIATDIGEAVTLAAISAFFIGNVVLQPPIGWTLDRMGSAAVTAVLLAGLGLLPLGFHAAAHAGLLPPLTFFWGGATFSLYLVGLTLIGRRFKGVSLVSANSAFIVVYQMGALAGPLAAGGAMDAFGTDAFPATFLVLAVLTSAFVFSRRG